MVAVGFIVARSLVELHSVLYNFIPEWLDADGSGSFYKHPGYPVPNKWILSIAMNDVRDVLVMVVIGIATWNFSRRITYIVFVEAIYNFIDGTILLYDWKQSYPVYWSLCIVNAIDILILVFVRERKSKYVGIDVPVKKII